MRCLPPLFLVLTSTILCVPELAGTAARGEEKASGPTIEQLKSWIADHELSDENLSALPAQPFAATALTAEDTLHADRGHWMNLEDAVAVPWMAGFTRNVWPNRIAWVQDDVLHDRFYWLEVSQDSAKAGDRIMASVSENEISIEHCDAKAITLLLSDSLLNLDKTVSVKLPSGATSQHEVKRTIADIARSLAQRCDRPATFSATLQIPIGESE